MEVQISCRDRFSSYRSIVRLRWAIFILRRTVLCIESCAPLLPSIMLLRNVENSQVAKHWQRKPITLLKIRDYFTWISISLSISACLRRPTSSFRVLPTCCTRDRFEIYFMTLLPAFLLIAFMSLYFSILFLSIIILCPVCLSLTRSVCVLCIVLFLIALRIISRRRSRRRKQKVSLCTSLREDEVQWFHYS